MRNEFDKPEERWKDPIVAEIRRIREEYAARFNYDMEAILRDIQEAELQSGGEFRTSPSKPTPQPTRSGGIPVG